MWRWFWLKPWCRPWRFGGCPTAECRPPWISQPPKSPRMTLLLQAVPPPTTPSAAAGPKTSPSGLRPVLLVLYRYQLYLSTIYRNFFSTPLKARGIFAEFFWHLLWRRERPEICSTWPTANCDTLDIIPLELPFIARLRFSISL